MAQKADKSPQALALQVLSAINKSAETAVMLDSVPTEFCFGEVIDLHRWSFLVKDDTMKHISQMALQDYYVNCSYKIVNTMLSNYWSLSSAPNGLLSLDISNSKDVTDYGITLVARASPCLKYLNMAGCVNIGDAGLREVGLSCTRLQTLLMRGCLGIEGSGFVSIADQCEVLSKLDLSHCKTLQRWCFVKIFYGCLKLEELNIAHLSEIGDNEIRVLAQNCPRLTCLWAPHCPYISDQSLLTISQHCPDIDCIDVSRNIMTFRITDVGLLALGQRSVSLRVLRAAGCDQLSDVGLGWLAQGCAALEELNVSCCPKVSDAGLRSIGSACHALTSLDISDAKLVSDVGIMTIATGCPRLTSLTLTGLYLLADPSLSAPKKGQKIEAWQNVVGIAALDMHCKALKHLNLTGCFRLVAALQIHVASLSQLTSLNLTRCNQCTEDSLVAVAAGCTMLEEINLTDCGKAVNGATMTAFADNCPKLKTVIVMRCGNIRTAAIKAISTIVLLDKLDLTGCRHITDSMILPLTEVDRVTKLRHLILVKVPLITDTTVVWVAYGCSDLLTFSLKYTRITCQSLETVKDRFPYSEIIQNDQFFGVAPKLRVEDRKLYHHYHCFRNGLIKLQARRRAVTAKRRAAGIAYKRLFMSSVEVVQRSYRVYQARCIVFHKRLIRLKIHAAATMVTSIFWMIKGKVKTAGRREEVYQVLLKRKTTVIQTHWRAHRVHENEKDMAARKLQAEKMMFWAASKMQAIVRMRCALRRVRLIKKMREAQWHVRNRKSGVIQRVYRGMIGRRRAQVNRARLYRLTILRQISSVKIQYAFRAHCTRSRISYGIEVKRKRLLCRVRIQAVFRGAIARLRTREKKLDITDAENDWAVRLIQHKWFCKKAMLDMKVQIQIRIRIARERLHACCAIQGAARQRMARVILKQKRKEHIEKLAAMVHVEICSATIIQAGYRAYRGRLRFIGVLRDKKGKWKELFDEAKQKRFFYNQLTGEIRWRMPQDLLDLIPRPACDNCSFYEAIVECGVCNEVFCHQCFDQIHHGGRRKDHEFRSVYDYYGKRIDYGDGIFPCKWPTEVMQDEAQGWMLRVAPMRDPIAVYDDCWAEYGESEDFKQKKRGRSAPSRSTTDDASVTSHHVSKPLVKGTSFFFNRATFETSYDMPPEVQHVIQQQEMMRNNMGYQTEYGDEDTGILYDMADGCDDIEEIMHDHYSRRQSSSNGQSWMMGQSGGSGIHMSQRFGGGGEFDQSHRAPYRRSSGVGSTPRSAPSSAHMGRRHTHGGSASDIPPLGSSPQSTQRGGSPYSSQSTPISTPIRHAGYATGSDWYEYDQFSEFSPTTVTQPQATPDGKENMRRDESYDSYADGQQTPQKVSIARTQPDMTRSSLRKSRNKNVHGSGIAMQYASGATSAPRSRTQSISKQRVSP